MAGCGDGCFFGGKKVGYKGDITHKFVIVGESPGAMELAKGMPFVGPAGELLEEVLSPYRKLIGDVFITNTIQCLPRQKDVGKLQKAATICNGRLLAELRAHPRTIILTLGNAALWSTTGDYNYKITQVRGRVFKSLLAEKGIVATIHPSFILRGGGNLQQFRRDVALAVEMYTGTKLEQLGDNAPKMRAVGKFKPSPYQVMESADEVTYLANLLKVKPRLVGADIETDGFNPREGKPICIGLSYQTPKGKQKIWVIPYELMTDELFNNECEFAWHNGKFDIGWLRHHNFPHSRVDHDTMLLSYLLNEKGGFHDLEQVGSDWLQAPNYKNILDKYLKKKSDSYLTIPPNILCKYQAIDADLTYHLAKTLIDHVSQDRHLWNVYTRILIPASEFIHTVERRGFLVDREKVKKNYDRLSLKAEEFEQAFIEEWQKFNGDLGGPNIRSPDQVKAFLYTQLKLAPESWSTDADTLEKLPSHPAVEALKAYRKVHKQLSTFVTPIGDKADDNNDRLHTTFKLHGTTTGRLSSNKPNMQNIPRDPDIRGQFIAPRGRIILECDLAQAEIRMLACLSKDPELCRIHLEGLSLHNEVSMYLFGSVDKEKKIIAKAVNFGIIYGIMAAGLANKLESESGVLNKPSVAEAQMWIDQWFERFPGAHEFLKKCRNAPIKAQTLVSAFGRKRRFGAVTRDNLHNLQNEAANFPEQSGASDITLLAGIRLQPILEKEYKCYIVNTVHDCLVIECPDDIKLLSKVAKLVCDTMEKIPTEWGLTEIPFKAEAELGYRWGNGKEFHYDKGIHPFKELV